MDLRGQNIIVIDTETLHSADDCRWCGIEKAHWLESQCPYQGDRTDHVLVGGHAPIGWRDFPRLGLSIGCWYDYADDQYHFFDQHTLLETVRLLLLREPLMVSFNGRRFDFPLMAALLPLVEGDERTETKNMWGALVAFSYDILDHIWQADPDNQFRQGNSLDAVSQANGYGAKAMNGAMAPRLWAEGRIAEVAAYCMDDVVKTRRLFEQICRGEPLQRQAGAVALLMPSLGGVG